MDSSKYYENSSSTVVPEEVYMPYVERPETYIVPVVFFIIFVVGVVGNGTLVIIFLRHRAMRTIPNTYIFSLALGDLLVIVTCVPFTSIIYTVESWPWGILLCKISESTKDISIGVSVFTLTALSAERYLAIVQPLRRLQDKPLTVLSSIMIWVLATGLSVPDAIGSRLVGYEIPSRNITIYYCYPFPDIPNQELYKRYMVIIKALIYYVIPLTIVGLFYVLMANRLRLSIHEIPGDQGTAQSASQARARRHVARMVLIFVFLFFICFLPHHVFMLWFNLNSNAQNEYNGWWHSLKMIGFFLSFLNSCVNPIALYCVSGAFRTHFNRYWFCRSPISRKNTISTNITTSNSTRRGYTQSSDVESQHIQLTHTLSRGDSQIKKRKEEEMTNDDHRMYGQSNTIV